MMIRFMSLCDERLSRKLVYQPDEGADLFVWARHPAKARGEGNQHRELNNWKIKSSCWTHVGEEAEKKKAKMLLRFHSWGNSELELCSKLRKWPRWIGKTSTKREQEKWSNDFLVAYLCRTRYLLQDSGRGCTFDHLHVISGRQLPFFIPYLRAYCMNHLVYTLHNKMEYLRGKLATSLRHPEP